MKKFLGLIAVAAIFLSSLAYAGGGQVCGDKANGSAGDSGQGQVEQNRGPNPD